MLMRHVEASIGRIARKWLHGQCVPVDVVLLTQLDHSTAFGNASPRSIEKISRQGVEDDIDAVAVGQLSDTALELGIARAEYVVLWYAEVVHQKLLLDVLSHR